MNMLPDIMLRALCWTLLHSLWQGLILAVLAGTMLVLTKRSSATLRYNLLCCGMILFLLTSGITFYLQLQTAGGVGDGRILHPNGQAGLVSGAVAEQPGKLPAINTGQPATSFFHNAIESLVGYFNTHAALVVLVWFIIFLARFVRLLSGVVYAQRIRYYQTKPAPAEWQDRLEHLIRKLRISRPVVLLESALIKVPVVVGFLKPAVMVPIGMLAQLPADQVESILLHELAHIRRRDYLFNLVQHIVDNLFFFNPALIWISSLIRTERENCCDDIAIRETRSRRRLIEALVSFHEYRQREGEFAVAFAGNKENQVVRRVKRIVHKTNHSLNAGERAVLMGVLLVLCAAFVTINHNRNTEVAKRTTPAAPAATAPAKVVSTTAAMPSVARPVVAADTSIKGVNKPAKRQQKPTQTKAGNAETTTDSGKDRPSTDGSVDTTGASYLGYRNISLDKLIQMKEHGVTAEYILSFRRMGYPNITPDQAIELRDHGVTVDFIQEFQTMGFKDISLGTARRLRDHGVTVEYIRSLVGMGYHPVDLDRATTLRDHGVTTDFIAQLNDLGFSHISLDMAQTLRDHGITADYIAACKKRFGKLFELNDYIKLRNAGINPTE